jgi:hypothetical protein
VGALPSVIAVAGAGGVTVQILVPAVQKITVVVHAVARVGGERRNHRVPVVAVVHRSRRAGGISRGSGPVSVQVLAGSRERRLVDENGDAVLGRNREVVPTVHIPVCRRNAFGVRKRRQAQSDGRREGSIPDSWEDLDQIAEVLRGCDVDAAVAVEVAESEIQWSSEARRAPLAGEILERPVTVAQEHPDGSGGIGLPSPLKSPAAIYMPPELDTNPGWAMKVPDALPRRTWMPPGSFVTLEAG